MRHSEGMRLLVCDIDREFEVDVLAEKIWFFRGPAGWVPPRMPADAQGISLSCPSVMRPGHCLMTVRDGDVVVRDLHSNNGVIIERAGLFHRVVRPMTVERDDIVHIGRPTIRLLN